MTTAATSLYSPLTPTPAAVQAAPAQASVGTGEDNSKDDSGFSFKDVLDTINPLQHIPIVATLYREFTGDTIKPAARIAGDGLYGGLIGLAGGVVDSVIETETGKDIGSHVMATLFGDDDADAAPASPPATVADTGATAASAPASADAAAANQPTGFFTGLQTGTHRPRGVPLSTTVPLIEVHPGDRAAANTALATAQAAQLKAIQANDAATASGAPAAAAPANNNAAPANVPSAGAPTPLAPQGIAIPSAPSAANTPPAAPANDAIAGMMMQNLDKYKAVAAARSASTGTAVNSVN